MSVENMRIPLVAAKLVSATEEALQPAIRATEQDLVVAKAICEADSHGWPDDSYNGRAQIRAYLKLARAAKAAAGVAELEAEIARLREDAARFQALMRCGRIKPQGSAGVNPTTGDRTRRDEPGSVHFGAEFWVQPEADPDPHTVWGRHCLRALADDILAYEAARPAAPVTTAGEGV